jgi:protein-disulfide isomerase
MNRTTFVIGVGLLATGVVAGAALHSWMRERCPSLTESEKVRLISVVRAKYKLPPATEIGVADGGAVFKSCFRELVFASLNGRPFRATLFASPDFHFLTKELLNAQPDPSEAAERRRETAQALARGNSPVRGMGKASVTVAVFSDFQCPFCARMAKTLNETNASEGDQVRIVYRYFPLSNHPWARPAAEIAACAQRDSNDAFWSLHDFLFAHQKELSIQNLAQSVAQWARTAPNLDQERFDRCIKQSLTSGQIEQDIALGIDLGVNGTPSVFLNGEPIEVSSADELRALVRRAAGAR